MAEVKEKPKKIIPKKPAPKKKVEKVKEVKIKEEDTRHDGMHDIETILRTSPHRFLYEDKKLERKHLIFLYVFEKAFGNITSACEGMNIGRSTFYFWKRENEVFSELIDEMDEYRLDFVESKLFENIEKCKEISIIFYLKTKGRHRGYIERIETDTRHEVVGFEFTDVNAEPKKIGNNNE